MKHNGGFLDILYKFYIKLKMLRTQSAELQSESLMFQVGKHMLCFVYKQLFSSSTNEDLSKKNSADKKKSKYKFVLKENL